MNELPAWVAIEVQKIAQETKSSVSISSYISGFIFAHHNGELPYTTNKIDRSYWFCFNGVLGRSFTSLEECVAELRKCAEQAKHSVSTPEEGDSQ